MHVAAVQIRIAALAGLETLLLRPGATIGAKVLERNGAHGLLLLAGTPVVAELPDEAVAGARLRLRVSEVGPDRITLQLVPEQAEPATAQPAATTPSLAAFALALPGGAVVRFGVDEREAGGQGGRDRASAVALRYDSPTLGRMDFRIGRQAVAIHASAGEPAQRAAAAADDLRAAIEAATGTPTQVTVHPRKATLDVRG